MTSTDTSENITAQNNVPICRQSISHSNELIFFQRYLKVPKFFYKVSFGNHVELTAHLFVGSVNLRM